MKQEIILNYINPALQIGLVSWREAYLLSPEVKPLHIETYKGRLIYRAKGSAKRISYEQIKKGLLQTSKRIFREMPDWPEPPALKAAAKQKRTRLSGK